MKKVLAILLSILILSTVGCGSDGENGSGGTKETVVTNVSVSQLENAFVSKDGGTSFSLSENSGGYTFVYSIDTYTLNCTFSGKADKDKNVTELQIVYNDIKTSYLTSRSEMERILDLVTANSDQITMNELKSCYPVRDYLELCVLVGASESNDVLDVFYNNVPRTLNGWTFKSEINTSSETVTVYMIKK